MVGLHGTSLAHQMTAPRLTSVLSMYAPSAACELSGSISVRAPQLHSHSMEKEEEKRGERRGKVVEKKMRLQEATHKNKNMRT